MYYIFYRKLKEWIRLLYNLFLPRCCAVCNRELLINEQHLCLICYAGLPLTWFWTIKDNPAEIIFWGRTHIVRTYSLYYYTNDYRKPIHELKYKSNINIGLYLGRLLGKKITEDITGFTTVDIIVPIPLHFRKKWKRGYNQSLIIAKGIQKGFLDKYNKSDIPLIYPKLLKRKHFTQTQTQKDRIHRWHNVAEAFKINYKEVQKIKNTHSNNTLHILLVDDVLTTGATIEACCNILYKHLNCRISIATLAYVE